MFGKPTSRIDGIAKVTGAARFAFLHHSTFNTTGALRLHTWCPTDGSFRPSCEGHGTRFCVQPCGNVHFRTRDASPRGSGTCRLERLIVRARTTPFVIGVVLLAAPGSSSAQESSRTPSPEELWNAYPLDPGGTSLAVEQGSLPAEATSSRSPAPSGPDDDSGFPAWVVIALVPPAAFVAGLVLGRGRETETAMAVRAEAPGGPSSPSSSRSCCRIVRRPTMHWLIRWVAPCCCVWRGPASAGSTASSSPHR